MYVCPGFSLAEHIIYIYIYVYVFWLSKYILINNNIFSQFVKKHLLIPFDGIKDICWLSLSTRGLSSA